MELAGRFDLVVASGRPKVVAAASIDEEMSDCVSHRKEEHTLVVGGRWVIGLGLWHIEGIVMAEMEEQGNFVGSGELHLHQSLWSCC